MSETGKSKTCVWRWQERFMHEGVDGLVRDKSRPPGKAPIPPERIAEIVRLTQEPPPHEATHWTLRAMAKVAGVAASTVQAIWKAHGLSPHRWRHFKLSNDPAFAEKLSDPPRRRRTARGRARSRAAPVGLLAGAVRAFGREAAAAHARAVGRDLGQVLVEGVG
jgi:transposase